MFTRPEIAAGAEGIRAGGALHRRHGRSAEETRSWRKQFTYRAQSLLRVDGRRMRTCIATFPGLTRDPQEYLGVSESSAPIDMRLAALSSLPGCDAAGRKLRPPIRGFSAPNMQGAASTARTEGQGLPSRSASSRTWSGWPATRTPRDRQDRRPSPSTRSRNSRIGAWMRHRSLRSTASLPDEAIDRVAGCGSDAAEPGRSRRFLKIPIRQPRVSCPCSTRTRHRAMSLRRWSM